MKNLYAILIAALSLFSASCSDDANPSTTGPLTLHFDNIVGTSDLELNTTNAPYTNGKGEAYNITRLSYYVSNIQLKKSDGSIFIDPSKADGSAGYYLIDESDEETQDITLNNLPAGDYTQATFTIGVDASKIDQTNVGAALDPENNLFWNWNVGYIFMAVEGNSTASTETGHAFKYHLGGYKDDAASNQVNNMTTITLDFDGHSAPVRAQHEPEVHLLLDVNKLFNGTGEQVTFAANANRDTPKSCKTVAENLSKAIVVDHIHAN